MSLKRLRKSEVKQLSQELPIDVDKKADVRRDQHALVIDGVFSFFLREGHEAWIPALPLLLRSPELLPHLVVDMGAVRHVVRGADIMRPGIVKVPDVSAGDLVVITDERHDKPLAVGKALFSGQQLSTASSGRMVENLHFVGDEHWKQYPH